MEGINEYAQEQIKRLSYSSLRSYLNNKQEFYKRYILKEPMEKMPIAMAIGSAVHKGIELFLKGKDPFIAKDLLAFTLTPGQELDLGDMTLEDAYLQIETALGWFHKLDRDWCEVDSEEGFIVNMGDGVRVKGFVDVIEEHVSGTEIIDFKTVGALSTGFNMSYFIQGLTYKMLADASGHEVNKATFIEIKRKPLKDRTKEHTGNMTRVHVFEHFNEDDVNALKVLYKLAYREIIDGEQYYLPNLFSQYTKEEDWQEWKERALQYYL